MQVPRHKTDEYSHIDVINAQKYNEIIFPNRPLIEDPKNLSFHGSIPGNVRDKIKQAISSDYNNMPVNADMIRREQLKDPYYRQIINFLKDRILPNSKSAAKKVLHQTDEFFLINDLLWKLDSNTQDIQDPRPKLVIPEQLSDIIVDHIHNRFSESGHSSDL